MKQGYGVTGFVIHSFNKHSRSHHCVPDLGFALGPRMNQIPALKKLSLPSGGLLGMCISGVGRSFQLQRGNKEVHVCSDSGRSIW